MKQCVRRLDYYTSSTVAYLTFYSIIYLSYTKLGNIP